MNSTTDPQSIKGPSDVIIITVKTWQVITNIIVTIISKVAEVARSITHLIGDNTLVIPLQNGIDSPTVLKEILGICVPHC